MGSASARVTDQFRKVQARTWRGGDAPWTTARRAMEAERAVVEVASSRSDEGEVSSRASRAVLSDGPGGSTSSEQQVRARTGVGQEERLSPGQGWQPEGVAGGQQPAGSAGTGGAQTASTGEVRRSGRRPSASVAATIERALNECRIGILSGV